MAPQLPSCRDTAKPLLDFANDNVLGIAEYQGVAHAQRLAIDFEYTLPLVVLNPEVVTNGDELLDHAVPLW